MKAFELQIVTPDREVFNGKAESVLVPTSEGVIEILADHIDYMAVLTVGKIRIISGGNSRAAACSDGFMTVSGGKARLICTTFEFADEIDVERASRAKEKAEQRLLTKLDANTEKLVKAKLMRALNRLKVSEL
jgi:F-type H+-transporting ATPase subunit epsilon